MYAVQLAVNFPLTLHIIQLHHSFFCLLVLSKYCWTRCLNIRCAQSCAVTEEPCQVFCVHGGRNGASRWTFLHRTNRRQLTLAIVIAAR
jgi:hypothetical protein